MVDTTRDGQPSCGGLGEDDMGGATFKWRREGWRRQRRAWNLHGGGNGGGEEATREGAKEAAACLRSTGAAGHRRSRARAGPGRRAVVLDALAREQLCVCACVRVRVRM